MINHVLVDEKSVVKFYIINQCIVSFVVEMDPEWDGQDRHETV